MKNIIFTLLILSGVQSRALAYTAWENSPNNWNNSPNNFQNSQYNYENSPYNWKNSPNNPHGNIIYDSNGNSQGYAVPKSNGSGVNMFDADGNPKGYSNYSE